MATLLRSGVPTSQLIEMLIKKQQKRSLGTSAEGLFSALVNGVSRRQETLQLVRLLPRSCLPLALPLTIQPLFHYVWH